MPDMAAIQPQELNKLFVLLHRSLLQYVGECWPWTAEDGRQTEILATIKSLIANQKQHEAALAKPLTESGWVLDFGGYPTLYTDLHYVSLTYLLKQLVISQSQIIAAFDAAAQAYSDSPLLKRVADSEREALKTIQSLSTTPVVTANAS